MSLAQLQSYDINIMIYLKHRWGDDTEQCSNLATIEVVHSPASLYCSDSWLENSNTSSVSASTSHRQKTLCIYCCTTDLLFLLGVLSQTPMVTKTRKHRLDNLIHGLGVIEDLQIQCILIMI